MRVLLLFGLGFFIITFKICVNFNDVFSRFFFLPCFYGIKEDMQRRHILHIKKTVDSDPWSVTDSLWYFTEELRAVIFAAGRGPCLL